MSNTTKKKIISLEVRDEYILGSGVAIGAQGSFDSSVLRVKFDDNWLGLNIYATWTDAQGKVVDQTIVTVLDLVDGEANTYDIPVPKDATQHAGTVKLALSGYVIGGEAGDEIESLLNTVSGAFRVLESSATPLDGGKSEASVAQQLLDSVNVFEKEIENRMSTLEGEMDARADALESAEDVRGQNEQERLEKEDARDEAEEQRQINEFGAVGNHYDSNRGCVVNADGDEVKNDKAGRVGAELERVKAEGSSEKKAGRVWEEYIRQKNENERNENEVARLKAEGSADENSEYYGGRALAEAERQGKEEERKKFYETAFVGKKTGYACAGVFNTEWDTETYYNLANARAATTFGFDNRIVNSEEDLKATHVYQKVFPDGFIPPPRYDDYGESTWGRHSFLAGGRNVLTAYSGVGLGENNVICGHQAVAIGYALRAYSARQFVCGKCNIPDIPPDGDVSSNGTYAFIVGNGTTSDPSNAFAVDWKGNAYISEELYIGKVSLTTKINNAIEKLINGAPGTMDTFAEIAALIGSEGKEATILGDIAKNATRISTAEALIEEHTKEIENLQAKLDNLVSAEGVSF